MSVAVLMTTHGHAAEYLRKTAEMIIGEQSNLACLEFVPGENGDILVQKMQTAISSLDVSNGLLLLVDLWGGHRLMRHQRLLKTLMSAKWLPV